MSFSSRDTSPDPLALPSSPLGPRSGNIIAPQRRTRNKPRTSNAATQNSSPSKSVIMETGDASPWRIKVTVEAEPKDGSSPAKKVTRTTKVPLKGSGSSSPTKRASATKKKQSDATDEEKRPQRKRKGTPIRRRNVQTPNPDEGASADGEQGALSSDSPSKRPAAISARTKAQPVGRSKRLSQAREELDVALRDAVGRSDRTSPVLEKDDIDDDDDNLVAGDMTIANEDFTMVSVETLQSMKQNTSQFLDNSGLELCDEKSAISVSYMPSSPPPDMPEVHYPDIEAQASAAKERAYFSPISTAAVNEAFDPMSWKPTGRVVTAQALRQAVHQAASFEAEVEGLSADRAIIIEDDANAGAETEESEPEQEEEEDIWADEASRSLEEDQHQQKSVVPPMLSPQPNDLFADQAPKPLRPKIPRTWRRNSGMDFSYVDSPEYGALRKTSGTTSTDGDGGSGVLTPPSTDDEAAEAGSHIEDEEDVSLTQPDAAGTQLQDVAQSPLSDSSSSNVASPDADGEDTGLFWQTNLPNVYQNRRERPRYHRQKRAMDLSELLNLNKSPQPPSTRKREAEGSASLVPASAVRSEAVVRNNTVSILGGNEKVVSSPLRKSLLKSSKIGGSVIPSATTRSPLADRVRKPPSKFTEDDHSSSVVDDGTEDSAMESFESKASDQRQLLAEMGMASSRERQSIGLRREENTVNDDTGHSQSFSSNEEETQDQINARDQEESDRIEKPTAQRTCSYEEHLNLESPQKIKVNFNDSEGNSSLLAPKKEYPPLFGSKFTPSSAIREQRAEKSPPSVTLVSKKDVLSLTPAQPGIFSRLSTTFWSAVVRPSGPAEILPTEQQPEPIYSHALRLDIRSRYGVVTDQHPWTMAHMRTLHRLHNSCTSGRSDSVVPKSGPLPSALEKLVGRKLVSVEPNFKWIFTAQHAHVVDAFMQTLVPDHIAQAIKDGEMDFLGDSEAKKHRGLLAGRHGDMIVFQGVYPTKEPTGTIQRDWVVKALGNCIMANIDTAAREEAERQRKATVDAERRAWERKNGFVYEDEDEE